MALHWDCKKMIERGVNIWTTYSDRKDDEQRMNPVTDSLIMATMIVGCDGRDILRFSRRIREYEIASGNLMHPPEPEFRERAIEANVFRADSLTEEGRISMAELQRHEGMSTNVSTMTDAAWAKNLARIIREEAHASIEMEKRKMERAKNG